MSKPNTEDPDLPPEPSPLDDDLPPPPVEPSFSKSRSLVPEPDVVLEEPLPSKLAEELIGSAEPPPDSPLLTLENDTLAVGGAKYRILKRLGKGGMGEVFLARKLGSSGFEREVALKTILPVLSNHRDNAAAFINQFVDEARLAALLNHPNICQVFDLQPIEGRGLLQVLEYIPGLSLDRIVTAARTKGIALTEAFACFVIGEVAAALDYAHHARDSNGKPLGIVHRDVTPHNIMLSNTGAVKLLDFGIAFSALDNREATTSNMVKGKDQFIAPEQILGSSKTVDGRADQFCLALCLYELLTLKRFVSKTRTDSTTQIWMRVAQLTPESVEEVLAKAQIGDSLKSILHHALAPSPDERFPTCADFGDHLRTYSQRRGWLYTAADARRELEALIALPDSAGGEKTNASGKKNYSAVPRQVPKKTTKLPALTPGRTAATPAPLSTAEKYTPAAAPSELLPIEDEPAEEPLEKSKSLKPSATAQRRRQQLQDELHNPKTSAKKMLALPAAILAATLLVGMLGVKLLILRAPSAEAPAEVVKTPEQLRAEREAANRAREPVAAPPQLAYVDPVKPAEVPPPTLPPAAAPPMTPPKPRRSTSPDAKAVDTLLAKQYGGRPVVTPESPTGTVEGAHRPKPRETVMMVDLDGPPAAATATPTVPKGTTIPARLTSAADGAGGPATAVVTKDVAIAGVVAVPKGTVVICQARSGGARVQLACDTLQLARGAITIDAVAIGADKRVGLPGGSVAGGGPDTGDLAKDNAINTGARLIGRVTGDGAASDVVNGASETAAGVARGQPRTQGATAALIAAGTSFSLFVQTPF